MADPLRPSTTPFVPFDCAFQPGKGKVLLRVSIRNNWYRENGWPTAMRVKRKVTTPSIFKRRSSLSPLSANI